MSAPRSPFIGGTASHVGKSWFTAAICRMLKRRGVRVAPFKAQNMSNNSYPCIEGGKSGTAQAEACGLPAESTNDGVIVPLFWLALGGPAVMAAYKAVNTLDSMLGYGDERYREFGWWSARADDRQPSPNSGTLEAAAAGALDVHPLSWRCWPQMDARLYTSTLLLVAALAGVVPWR